MITEFVHKGGCGGQVEGKFDQGVTLIRMVCTKCGNGEICTEAHIEALQKKGVKEIELDQPNGALPLDHPDNDRPA